MVKAISGVTTVRFKNELVRNITIKLGYANAKVRNLLRILFIEFLTEHVQIYKCENDACPRPGCYRSYRSDKEDNPPCERPGCGSRMKLVRHVSFVDCPGHDILMATMLNGAAVMDAALLLIAGNETCPQPQTSEHLAAVEIMKLEHIIILQNKVDLIKEAQALEHQKSIAAFVKGTFDASLLRCYRELIMRRHCCRELTHRSHLCSTEVQHRRSQRIHRQACPYSHT